MTDALDDRLRDLGTRWRDHSEDHVALPDLPSQRPRRDLTWVAAAVIVAIALGTTLWLVRDVGGGPQEPTPAQGPVAWKPLDPTQPALDPATTAAYDAIGVTGDLDLTVGQEERVAFTVTLTSPTRVSLSPCPDYEIEQQNSWDDYTSEQYALNCAAVPFKDGGVPYLPAGTPVTFAMEAFAPTASLSVTWRLATGGEPDHVRGRFLMRDSVGTVPRTANFCARLTFDGRAYKFATEQPGSGVGRPLGNASGAACGSRGPAAVAVYSANEQSAQEALTASYDGVVVVYVPSDLDLASFPDLHQDVASLTADDVQVATKLARFAIDPSTGGLTTFAGEGVRVGLGADLRTVPTTELTDPATWTFDTNGFAGAEGPVNTLDVVREQLLVASQIIWGNSAPDLALTVGDHRRCAGPAGVVPEGLSGLRHLSLQPAEETIDSCLDWFAVDVYLDEAGKIAAVGLDLWEP